MTIVWDGLVSIAVDVLNAVISAMGSAISLATVLLPPMPTMPTLPSQMVNTLGWVNWFFPVGTVVDILAFLVGAWAVWLVVRVVLAWGKVVAE